MRCLLVTCKITTQLVANKHAMRMMMRMLNRPGPNVFLCEIAVFFASMIVILILFVMVKIIFIELRTVLDVKKTK
jgi:hypothetical protein